VQNLAPKKNGCEESTEEEIIQSTIFYKSQLNVNLLATKQKQFASASRKTKIIIQISVNSKCTAT
jgi:hypothetical protein